MEIGCICRRCHHIQNETMPKKCVICADFWFCWNLTRSTNRMKKNEMNTQNNDDFEWNCMLITFRFGSGTHFYCFLLSIWSNWVFFLLFLFWLLLLESYIKIGFETSFSDCYWSRLEQIRAVIRLLYGSNEENFFCVIGRRF